MAVHYVILLYLVPNEALTVRVAPLNTKPVAGQPLELTCCASTSAEALALQQPSLQWHKDGQVLAQGEHVDIHTSDMGQERCLTVLYESLEHEDVGVYTCRGALQSTGMEDILVRETQLEVIADFIGKLQY